MSTVTIPKPSIHPPRAKLPLPPLENGDRLNRAEYLKRYAAMPPDIKAERIEGIVHMAAAASADFHGRPHAEMMWWLVSYRVMTLGVAVADNSTVHLDIDNDPQPDACMYILPSHGGQMKTDDGGFILGAPEFVAEIAASSMSYDLGVKQNAYRRNGVKEYVVHRTYDGEVDWFILRDGAYERLIPDTEGVYRSEAFPGLWLASEALISGNLAEVLRVLQQGLATPEHAAFADRLAAAAKQTPPA